MEWCINLSESYENLQIGDLCYFESGGFIYTCGSIRLGVSGENIWDKYLLVWKHLKGKPSNLQFGYLDKRIDEPDQPKSFANLNSLKRLINWQPTYSIDSGIKKTINIMSKYKGEIWKPLK